MTDPIAPEPAPQPQPQVQPGPQLMPPLEGQTAPSPNLSIISMILGILGVLIGLVGGGLLFSVGGVVLGHLGQRKEPEAKGFWLTGLITGYVGILLNLIVIVVWIVVFIALAAAGDNFTYPG